MPFFHSLARRLQFILGDEPVQNALGEKSYGEWPALLVVTVSSPEFPGLLTDPFVNSREDCAGGSDRAPGALVVQPPHSPSVSGKAI